MLALEDGVIPGNEIGHTFIAFEDGAVERLPFTQVQPGLFQRSDINQRGDRPAGFRQHAHFDKDVPGASAAIDNLAFVFGGNLTIP